MTFEFFFSESFCFKSICLVANIENMDWVMRRILTLDLGITRFFVWKETWDLELDKKDFSRKERKACSSESLVQPEWIVDETFYQSIVEKEGEIIFNWILIEFCHTQLQKNYFAICYETGKWKTLIKLSPLRGLNGYFNLRQASPTHTKSFEVRRKTFWESNFLDRAGFILLGKRVN